MSDVLKILMMGGKRAGKSSVLAGLINTMTNGNLKNLISVEDITDGENYISKKIVDLKYHLRTSLDKIYLIDDNERSNTFQNYKLRMSVPETDSTMDIVFTDIAGEFFTAGNAGSDEIRELVRTYDVFIVAIDTPYLMEAVNPDNELCYESVNKSYNFINDIHSFLTDLDDKEGTDAKLVVFVPLKCEKWIHEGKTEYVLNRVRQVYENSIRALSAYANVEIDIMPIQTVGNIEFYEHQYPYICSTDDKKNRRCCLIEDETKIRFENGEEEMFVPGHHIIKDDGTAVTRTGGSILRPNSWFKTIGTDYKPENCDQLAYYILDFFLSKVLFAKNVEKIRETKSKWTAIKIIIATLGVGFGGILFGIAGYLTSRYLEKKFGTFTLEQMQTLVSKLRDGGYIKRNCQGIQTIKESKLKNI